jgi:subtilase family serine protease
MNLQWVVLRGLLVAGIFLCQIHVQTVMGQVRPRVAEAVDDARRTTLSGNVHPLARAEFDRGAVAESQPMNRILLLLKRSDEQEAALQDALAKQQDKSSPSFHQWLTPEQFGAEFGPADADIQAVTDWLTRQGFTIGKIYSGKTVIEFSGSAGQVQRAFGTVIRNYEVGGKLYSANASDPQIPAALAPVVTGVVSLHNFPRQSHARYLGEFRRTVGKPGLQPLFTFPRPNGTGNFYGMGPGDFATIYNSKALISGVNNGSGQTIAIVGETQLNPQDIIDFRTMFGLPANFAASNIILNGEDPGITSMGEESEADLDVQWSGATAPGATVKYVVSASTPASSGVDLSALYIIEHNLADVMSESYGECEKNLGAAGNNFYNALWEQAAAQGITVVVSSGDGGSAGCDNFDIQRPATQGLAVSGIAGTPFNVSVGGTDFNQASNPTLYWSATNDATGSSAIGYIPEIPWNESCAQIGLAGCGASAPNGSLNIVAGSGGPSSVYAKPGWQMGVSGIPNDSHRDQPDVSLFASPGFDGTGYVFCQQDRNLSGLTSCDLNTTNGNLDFHIIGGTSASAPAFAGVMALVNQYQAGHGGSARQGNANHTLYALAKKSGASCTSSTAEAAGCVFNDVATGNSYIASHYGSSVGTNSVPCQGGTPNCSVAGAASNGVLVDPAHTSTEGWMAGAGYDMATGLGTVNVNNLATKWGTVSTVKTTTNLTLSPTSGITHGSGENVTVNISVAPTGGTATGNVSLIATLPGPSGTTTQGLDQFALDGTGKVTNATTKSLPGGTNYTVTAHYAGDGTNAPSDSAAVTVNVGPENSKTFLVVPTFDWVTGQPTNGNASSFPYGSRALVRVYVTNASGTSSLTGPPAPLCESVNELTCPTGTVTLTDNAMPLDRSAGIYNLNVNGYTRDLASTLQGGTHQLAAAYSGDNSYNTSSTSSTITITPAPTTSKITYIPNTVLLGGGFLLNFETDTQVPGVAPTGTVTYYYDGNKPLPLTTQVYVTGWAGIPPTTNSYLSSNVSALISTPGSHTITATYSGDGNYQGSTSSPQTIVVQYPTTMTQVESSASINYGQSITITAKVTTSGKNPPMAGQFQFNTSWTSIPNPVIPTLSVDGSGNQALTATVTTTPQASESISVNYTGDTFYNGSGTNGDFVTVNIPDFSVSSSNAINAPYGQTVMTPVTVTPLSTIPSTATLSIGNILPPGVTASLSPTTVNLNGAPVSVTLTIGTTGPSPSPQSAVKAQVRRAGIIGMARTGGWSLAGASALALAFLLGMPNRRRRYRAALFASVLCLAGVVLGCGGGGGGSGGGGGGGGGGPAPSSISISSSNTKVPAGAPFTLTGKVTSTKPVTGTVTFFQNGNQIASPVAVVDGVATLVPQTFDEIGTFTFTASYSGDTNNLPSQTSTGVVEAFTGTVPVLVQAQTRTVVHTISVNINLQ